MSFQFSHALTIGAFLILTPATTFAAGSYGDEPPEESETSTKCGEGQLWDENKKSCVDAEESSLSDDIRYQAVRELAWAEKYNAALIVLAAMDEGETDRVLTYLGFINRRMGNKDLGLEYYARALEKNPDNILARSYLGQMMVEEGDIAAASRQLAEIRNRGGQASWAETSLAMAVGKGEVFNY